MESAYPGSRSSASLFTTSSASFPGEGPRRGSRSPSRLWEGAATDQKGSGVILEAVRALERAGRSADYRLLVVGWVKPGVERELARVPSVSLVGPYTPEDLDQTLDRAESGFWRSRMGS